jgi:hypothetical protein
MYQFLRNGEAAQNPKLVAPGLQKPSAGAGVRIENGRWMTSKQSEEHLWMGRRDGTAGNAAPVFRLWSPFLPTPTRSQ